MEDGTFVRLLWCDLAGVRRVRVIPSWRYEDACQQGVSVTKAIMALTAFIDAVSPNTGLTSIGAVDIKPDTKTCRPCPWHRAHKLVHVSFQDGSATWSCSPRDQLRLFLEHIRSEHGLTFQFGQEIEFYLLDPSKPKPGPQSDLPPPLDVTSYAQALALNSVAAVVLDEICAGLVALGVSPEQYHPESGPGQFELVLPHSLGVEAADSIIFARETISAVSAKHGLEAMFLPKPYSDEIGSAAHTHLSVWNSEGDNITSHGHKDERGKQFLAGMLHHLPAMCLFIAPSPASYDRIQPHTWSGAFQCWGIEHKEAALRFCPGPSTKSTNIEVKTTDSTNNPYVAFTALVTAGLQGIIHKMNLPAPCEGEPADDKSLVQLPENIGEALATFREDQEYYEAMEQSLGKELLTAFLGVRFEEAKISKEMSMDTKRTRLLHRY